MQEIFDQYINYLKAERNASPYTVRNYTNDLIGNYRRGAAKGFFQYLKLKKVPTLKEVDKHILRGYISWLMEREVVKVSIARKLSAVRSFYRYLVREEVMPSSEVPISLTRKMGERLASFSPKLDKLLPEFLNVEETFRLIGAPDLSTPQGLRDRALLELLYASGMRVSEVAHLDLGAIDLDMNEIRVWGKGSKERMVLFGQPAHDAINAYLSAARPKLLDKKRSPALFVTQYGGRFTPRRIQKVLDKYAGKASIGRKVHPHLLRHTFATHLLDGGADLKVVQELLGHARLSSTQIYASVSHTRLRKTYLSAHPMAREKADESSQPAAKVTTEVS